MELKSEDGVISYGLLNKDRDYPNVSKIETIRLKDPLYISHLYKHTAETYFKKRTTFLPHKDTSKTGLTFMNTICVQTEQTPDFN